MLFVDDVVKMKAALALLASFATLALTGAHHCPDDWVLFGDSCYAFLDDRVPWVTAQAYCHMLHSKMLEVESKAENDFIVAQIRSRTGIDYVWNGINDLVREGKWVLNSNNQRPPYLNWKSDEPNSYEDREDCAVIAGVDGTWRDFMCDNYKALDTKLTPVCERKAKKKTKQEKIVTMAEVTDGSKPT